MDRAHFDDLTKINVPYGLLDDDTQERLRAHGGPYEVYCPGWEIVECPSWGELTAYRVAPPKPRPLVVKDWAMLADWVRYVTRDEHGQLTLWEQQPQANESVGRVFSLGEWEGHGELEVTVAISPALIDPGTCDWREAIDCRDNPNNSK